MKWFGKKREVVDLTDKKMQDVAERSAKIVNSDSGTGVSNNDVLDLSTSSTGGRGLESAGDSTPMAGFLSKLASAGGGGKNGTHSDTAISTESRGSSYGSYTEKLKDARSSRLAEFKNMQVKIDDLDYKLDRMMERLAKLEERF